MKKVSYGEIIGWKDDVKKNDLFLDVGCWSGSTVLEMNEKCDAYGIDFNRETLKLADERITGRLKYSDITEGIDFDKEFDWVLCSEVVEHIEEDDKALKNIAGVMRKGGKLILSTPRSLLFFEFWDPAWVRWKFGGKERHYHYRLDELNKKFENAGLKVLKYSCRGNLLWVFWRWVDVFLNYGLGAKRRISNPWNEGFCDWVVLAERI